MRRCFNILLIIFSILYSQEVFDGYTLFTTSTTVSQTSYATYLIDNDLNIINEWDTNCHPASMSYLMPDSTLIYPCEQENIQIEDVAASGGRIIKYDWSGNVLWDWSCDWGYQLHHDIEPTPDGTILAIAIESINGFQPDLVLEIQPQGENEANLIWTWRVYNHRGDLYSPYTFYENANYNQADWNHFNAIHLNSRNEIYLCSRNWGEIYIIPWGGNSDLLYRWGNPQNYGINEEQKLFAPHGVNEIIQGYPGEGNIILFNNNNIQGQNNNYSIVMELEPPRLDDGSYFLQTGDAFGPQAEIWSYQNTFFSAKQSGAFRLPNGNTYITVAGESYLFEVTYDGQIVWEHFPDSNSISRSQKYGLDYLSIIGDLNYDGFINILDAVLLINLVMENDYNSNSDINNDGSLNILDVVNIINIILDN